MRVGTSIINNITQSNINNESNNKLDIDKYMYNKNIIPIIVYLPKSPQMLGRRGYITPPYKCPVLSGII